MRFSDVVVVCRLCCDWIVAIGDVTHGIKFDNVFYVVMLHSYTFVVLAEIKRVLRFPLRDNKLHKLLSLTPTNWIWRSFVRSLQNYAKWCCCCQSKAHCRQFVEMKHNHHTRIERTSNELGRYMQICVCITLKFPQASLFYSNAEPIQHCRLAFAKLIGTTVLIQMRSNANDGEKLH